MIFANVAPENEISDQKENWLRISIDSKAKVKIGNLSRGGKAGSLKPLKADDHAHKWTNVLDFIGNKQNFLLIPVFVFLY